MIDISKLEQQKSFADEYGDRIAEWDLLAVAMICREIGKIGKMTPKEAEEYAGIIQQYIFFYARETKLNI